MGNFLRLLFDWLVDSFHIFFDLLALNIAWLLVCLPVITAPSATLALFAAANHLAHEGSGGWGVFWQAVRRDAWLALRWAAVNLAAMAILASNLAFYARYDQWWSIWVQGVFISLAWVWGLLQVYALPLLMEQSDRRLRVAYRNSLVLWARQPAIAFGFGATLSLGVILISVFLGAPWLVIGVALAAYLANRAVLQLLENEG